MNCVTFNPPSSHVNLQVTIDSSSFEVKANSPFGGIKNLPNGIHLITFESHTSVNTDGSTRYGYWFEIGSSHEGYYIQYDQPSGQFKMFIEQDSGKYLEISNRHHPLMVSYPQIEEDEGSWFNLTKYIKRDQVASIFRVYPGYTDTSMTTLEEIQWLDKKLKHPHSSGEPIFNYTVIKFKSSDAIRDDHKMQDFLDKSYYLHEKIIKRDYHGHINRLFGELQLCFLTVLLFGNYGSSMQWHNIVELMCFSSDVSPSILSRLDECLSLQLARLPEEYVTLLNEKVWRKCLTESFHYKSLKRTRAAIQLLEPAILRDADTDSEDEPTDAISDEEEDANKPTIAGGVFYQRR